VQGIFSARQAMCRVVLNAKYIVYLVEAWAYCSVPGVQGKSLRHPRKGVGAGKNSSNY
jgi:hypothetical protein